MIMYLQALSLSNESPFNTHQLVYQVHLFEKISPKTFCLLPSGLVTLASYTAHLGVFLHCRPRGFFHPVDWVPPFLLLRLIPLCFTLQAEQIFQLFLKKYCKGNISGGILPI